VCGRCKEKKEACQWGARIVFREENNRGLSTPQSFSKNKKPKGSAPGHFEIQDITAEVIRDHQQQETMDISIPTINSTSTKSTHLPQMTEEFANQLSNVHTWEMTAAMDLIPVSAVECPDVNVAYQQPLDEAVTDTATALPAVDDLSYIWPSPTALGLYDDSIFLPGSAYLDAHSTLRSHLIQEVNASNGTTHDGTHELAQDDKIETPVSGDFSAGNKTPQQSALTEEEEFALLKNWVEERTCARCLFISIN
jgi:hypothetical protein